MPYAPQFTALVHLATAEVPVAVTTIYTAPTGDDTDGVVLTSLSLYNDYSADETIVIFVSPNTSDAMPHKRFTIVVPTKATADEGRLGLVIPAGWYLRMGGASASGRVSVHVSGGVIVRPA